MRIDTRHSGRRRGAGVIGLLMALVIIAILTIMYMQQAPPGDGPGDISPTSIQRDLDRTRTAACQANRAMAQAQITGWLMAHPGQTPTVEALRAGGVSLPPCPDGGELSAGPGGHIFCSIHQPDPHAPQPAGGDDDPPFPPPRGTPNS